MPKANFQKIIAENPIKIPDNPFWSVFKRFGRDEFIALVINASVTAVAGLLTAVTPVIVLAGPVVEKFGFFAAYLREAFILRKISPPALRKPLAAYLKTAFKRGLASLIEDLLVHDPAYALLMLLGLKVYAQTPAWILSAMSFIIAVLLVAFLEVAADEFRYWRFKKRCVKAGFGTESYFESRFCIDASFEPEKVIDRLSREFGLDRSPRTLDYQDTYFENKIPSFSLRRAFLRLRKRTATDGGGWTKTAQIVFTRASELSGRQAEQFRYFPIRKEKVYLMLDQEMPLKISEIRRKKGRKILSACRAKDGSFWHIGFKRIIARSQELLAAVDAAQSGSPYYFLEIKVYRDIDLLKRAMQFVMIEFPVRQTTHGKIDLQTLGDV